MYSKAHYGTAAQARDQTPDYRHATLAAGKLTVEDAVKLSRQLQAIFLSMVLAFLAACTSSPTDRTVGTALSDTAISAKVKAALAGDPDVKATDVQVETYRGTVQLSGFVDSQENIRRALDVARRVDGVTDVKNALAIKPTPETR